MTKKGATRAPLALDIEALPVLRTSTGAPLERAATAKLVEELSWLPEGNARAAAVEAKATLDAASLADFVVALVDAWQAAGAPRKQKGLLHAAALLGDDRAAQRLAWWATQEGGLARQARLALARYAETNGISEDELADRVVPDLGFDDRGALRLTFGPRSFEVGLDAELRPFVVGESGKRTTTLPRIRKSDDPSLAAEAHRAWTTLKVEAKALGAERIRRLERAMVAMYTWSLADFRRHFAEHRLMRHLARRLVWGAMTPTLALAFRIAEDGTYADSFDVECALPRDERTRIGVVHPLLMTDDERVRWRDLFRDYAIVQPFSQLGREIFVPTELERDAHATARWEGKLARGPRFFALKHRGWTFDGFEMAKHLAPGEEAPRAVIHTEPGVDFSLGSVEDQTLGALELQAPGRPPPEGAPTFGELPPVVVSELFRDVEALLR